MKKKLSVFSMISGHSLSRVLVILAGLAAANAGVFYLGLGTGFTNLHSALDTAAVVGVFLAAFALLSLVLCTSLRDRGGHQNYFLHRLCVSPRVFYWNHALYNTLCYVLLFAVEAATLLALCAYAGARFGEAFNHQSIMLACYQSNVLHTFFPLSDVLGWVTNGAVILALGICTAALPARNRGGSLSITTFLMCGAAAFYVFFLYEDGALYIDMKIIILTVSVFCAAISGCGVCWMEVEEDA